MPEVGAGTGRDPIEIPAPLDGATWRQLLDAPPDADLFGRIVMDRNALFLAAALAATDDSIRALVGRDRDLLRFLYREGSGGFVIVSRALALVDGQLALPGGPDAPRIWETLTGAPPALACAPDKGGGYGISLAPGAGAAAGSHRAAHRAPTAGSSGAA